MYILKNESGQFFECNYSCDNAIFINLEKEKFFITDARYFIEADECIKNAKVVQSDDLIKTAKEILKQNCVVDLEFDPWDFCVAEFENLKENLEINFIKKSNFSQTARIVKKPNEIELLKKSAKLGEYCFDEFAKYLKEQGEGKTEIELNFIAAQIFRKNFGDLSFNPIFAINENAAKAHALPTSKKLKKGDLVLLDAGGKFKRYCSDRTRTAFFDENFNFTKLQNFKNEFINKIYQIVLQSQTKAIKAIKPGVKAFQIDKIARDVIAKSGYEKYFFHSTGHGVGIDIHELPRISKSDETILKEGMVFSVEPGIYIKDKFGIRIEDVVLVTKNGCEIL